MLTRKTKNVAIFSTVYFIASCAVVLFVANTILTEGEMLENRSVTVLKNDLIQQRYSELLQIINDTDTERVKLKEHLLTEESTINFLSEIESIARTDGVVLTTSSLEVSDTSSGEFQTLLIKFAVQGEESSVERFLKTLESLPYYSQVTELSLSRVMKSGSSSSLSGSVSLVLSLGSYD